MSSHIVSPSWQALFARSPGAPGTTILRRAARREAERDDLFLSTATVGRSTLLGRTWLLPYQRPPRASKSSTTPFLTVALLKLHEVLPEFAATLVESPAKAAAVVDSTVATAGSPASSPHNSPTGKPSAMTMASPLFTWLTTSDKTRRSNEPRGLSSVTSSPSTPPSSSAQALEGEWETYSAPFLLLAGAEAAYADLQHLDPESDSVDEDTPSLLVLVYQRIIDDLVLVKQSLCDPFMGEAMMGEAATSSTTDASMLLGHVQAAEGLAAELAALTSFCTLRMQLIDVQRQLWQTTTSLFDAAALVTLLLQSMEEGMAGESFRKLREAFSNECQSWKYGLEAAFALERCQFLESILSLRRWKNCLPEQETRLGKWFHRRYHHFVSLLPIYFDRVRCFAHALYGFDTAALMKGKRVSADLNGMVVDFLRRQDKAGGPPTVVAVVIDAVTLNNLHIEHGVQLTRSNLETEAEAEEDPRTRWPAVYMRSTTHLSSQSQRTMATSESSSSSNLKSSQSNLLTGWSGTPVSSPVPTLRRKSLVLASHIVEYGPDTGPAKSWPHCEWDQLVLLLDPQAAATTMEGVAVVMDKITEDVDDDAVVAVTYREAEDLKGRDSIISIEGAASLFSKAAAHFDETTDDNLSPGKKQPPSTFHIVTVSDSIQLVVMVKGEEKSWHRRRNPLSDEDVRSFLTDLANRLRVHPCFTAGSLPLPEDFQFSLEDLQTTRKEGAPPALSDADAATLLKQVKEAFGLRPISPLHTGGRLRSPGSLLQRQQLERRHTSLPSDKYRKSRRRRANSESLEDSAAVWFLGPDLARDLRSKV